MAVVPTSHTFGATTATSSEANTFIRDVLDFLQNKPAAELRQTVSQTVVTGTWTSLTFTTEDLDKDPAGTGGHDNVTNPSRYTAVYAGWYLVGGGVAWAVNATGVRGLRWLVNGSTINASWIFLPATAATGAAYPAKVKRLFLNAGDYVELQVYQTSGGNLITDVTAESASSFAIGWDRLA